MEVISTNLLSKIPDLQKKAKPSSQSATAPRILTLMNGLLLELVSKELNHLAATILHVNAGGLNFMK